MKLTAHNAKTSCYVNKREEKEEDDMNGKLFIGSILAGVFALAHTSFSAEWKPVAGTMMTESGENISPDNAANLPKVSEEGIPKNQPNFVVILTDDQGWGTTSITVDPAVPESKSDFFKTPNLEKLASQGLRFTQAYSGHPNCSPSRAAAGNSRPRCCPCFSTRRCSCPQTCTRRWPGPGRAQRRQRCASCWPWPEEAPPAPPAAPVGAARS